MTFTFRITLLIAMIVFMMNEITLWSEPSFHDHFILRSSTVSILTLTLENFILLSIGLYFFAVFLEMISDIRVTSTISKTTSSRLKAGSRSNFKTAIALLVLVTSCAFFALSSFLIYSGFSNASAYKQMKLSEEENSKRLEELRT